MQKRHHSKRWIFPLVLIAALSLSVVTYAAAPLGSITVQLCAAAGSPAPLSATAVTVRRVADCVGEKYVLTPDYAASDIALHTLSNTAQKQAEAAQKLTLFAEKKHLSGTQIKTDAAGVAVFSNLDTGMYLVQIADVKSGGFTAKTDPFFVTIPLCAPDGASWIYNVTAQPKRAAYADETPLSPAEKLPQTGQKTLRIWLFAAAGVCCIAVGGRQRYRSKKEHKYAQK
ncbi:MAG: pilin N-terminal domain-containing protein [Ruthenibacterium sp.]